MKMMLPREEKYVIPLLPKGGSLDFHLKEPGKTNQDKKLREHTIRAATVSENVPAMTAIALQIDISHC